jgi:hypothetical protein
MSCWNDGNLGKLICSDGGREKGRVGLQVAVFDVSSVTSALRRMKMNFFNRCLVGVDMLLVDECWLSKREDFTDNFVADLTQLASVCVDFHFLFTRITSDLFRLLRVLFALQLIYRIAHFS